MIEHAAGGADLFAAQADILVNPVNAQGRMGKGLALQFKTRFPEMDQEYRKACAAGELAPGGINVWKNPTGAPRYIVNLATKDSPFQPSQYEWVESGLKALRKWSERVGIETIASPALGAGLGGLNEARVRDIADRVFADSTVKLLWHGKLERSLETASEKRASATLPLFAPQATTAREPIAPPHVDAEYLVPGVSVPAGFVDAGALGPTKRSGTLLYQGKAYDPAHAHFFLPAEITAPFRESVERLMGPLDNRNGYAAANALALGMTAAEAVPFIENTRAAWEKFSDRMPPATGEDQGFSADDFQAVETIVGRPLSDADMAEIALQARRGLDPKQVSLVLQKFDEIGSPEDAPVKLRIANAGTLRDEKNRTGTIAGISDMGYVGRSKWVPDDLGITWYHALRNQNNVASFGGKSGPAITAFESDLVAALDDARPDAKAMQAAVARIVDQAEKTKAFTFVCHCSPSPCHCNVLLTYVGLDLKKRGQTLDVLDIDRERAKEYRGIRKMFTAARQGENSGGR